MEFKSRLEDYTENEFIDFLYEFRHAIRKDKSLPIRC
ncbi:bacteriocin immunity protein [Atlantibacter hermannii]|nr:bacteriocin immunity protein [Atlantibacter hermannii]